MSRRTIAARISTSIAAVGAAATFVYFHGFDCAPWFRDVEAVIVTALLCAFAYGAWQRWYDEDASISGSVRVLELVVTTAMALVGAYRVWTIGDGSEPPASHVEMLAVHAALLVLAGITVAREAAHPVADRMLRLHPAAAFALSYVVLSVFGACLLMLPEMTTAGRSLDPLDAIFTSVSACCVTGLIVVDTATHFSVKGQTVILVLIQLGGLNAISFATYFLIYGTRTAPRGTDRVEVEEFLHADSRAHLYRTLAITAAASVVIEAVAAFGVYAGWKDQLASAGGADPAFSALFHAVSAFNNAGFSVHSGGLTNPALQGASGLHAVIGVLIVLGGLGVPVLCGLAGRRPSAATRVAVAWGAALLVVGAALYWTSESIAAGDTTIAASLFQSVTARTAGFSTVDIASLSSWTLLLLAALMFVGASTGSTAGGIKTSTVAVMVAGLRARVQGREPTLFGARLPVRLIRKAVAIAGLAAVTVVVGIAVLAYFEPNVPLRDLAFEEVSAFGTVGLSTGITPGLSPAGKTIVMVTILLGRIGPLAIGLTVLGRRAAARVVHTDFLVG